MEWNYIDNALQNDPMLIDSHEQSAMVNLSLDLLGEFEKINRISNERMNVNEKHEGISKINFAGNPQTNCDKSDQLKTTIQCVDAITPPAYPHISQPQSVTELPELDWSSKLCHTQNKQTQHVNVVRKRKTTDKKCKLVNSGNQRRGRPRKNDAEGNVDPKALRKRNYARKYQQNVKADFAKAQKQLAIDKAIFRSIHNVIKESMTAFPEYNGILGILEVRIPEFKEMIQKNFE